MNGEVQRLTTQDILKQIDEFQPDLIGLTATTPFFPNISDVAKNIKACSDIPIIVGGAHVSLIREQSFLDIFDYLFIGECENTFPQFLKSFSEGRHGEGVLGIMRRQDGKIVYAGDPPRQDDLDKIPWPARDLLPYKKYFVGTLRGKKNYTSLFMSRGCPFQCVFCANTLYGKKVRRRAIDQVIKEIDHIVNTMGIKHIYFLDDTLTLNREYILSLCRKIKEHRLKFTFEGSTRANLWDEELVQILKSCGLIRISFGLETASSEVRKIIKKEIPMESYLAANELNKKYKIETINSVMLGLPGDTRESIEETVRFLRRSRAIQHATYSIAIPYPGTEMHEMAKKKMHGLKIVDENFSNYQRYGSAVMEVSGIKPEELVYIQKRNLFRIYSCWWRIWPILKRHGLRALIVPVFDAAKTIFLGFFKRKWVN